jgi:hypothetical protein
VVGEPFLLRINEGEWGGIGGFGYQWGITAEGGWWQVGPTCRREMKRKRKRKKGREGGAGWGLLRGGSGRLGPGRGPVGLCPFFLFFPFILFWILISFRDFA